MGGQWVGQTQTEVLGLIEELGLETFLTYDTGAALTVFNGTITRYEDETFGLPEEGLKEVGRLQGELESLAGTVSLSSPWMTPQADLLDRQTLDTWLTAHTSDEVALSFYRILMTALFAAEAWEMSLLHFLFYIKSGGMLDIMVSTTGGPMPPAPVVYVQAPTNGMAVASLVLGILSLPLFWLGFLLGTLAIIFGAIGRGNARRGAPRMKMATWGLALGIVGVLASIALFAALEAADGVRSTASPKGLPSVSRQTLHRSPEWMTSPPSSRTRCSAASMFGTEKYGSDTRSPGPVPLGWRPSAEPPRPGPKVGSAQAALA